MADLNGQYTVTFDPKSGRLAIPARHRKGMPEDQRSELYVTRGFEHCVTAYYKDSWAEFKEKITDKTLKKKQLNALKRQFIGRMTQAAFDKQGRISLNSDLVEWANLQKESEVIVVGCEDYLEIWNAKSYKEYAQKTEDDIQALYEADHF
ncbi:MAG: hypothetical protein U5R06_03495 [candidate division KSB1 bacterium]|nr:hypothetical protein [candidate division KSB1 bacterium]